MVLMLFVLSVLALVGMQFFMGVLKHKCVVSSPSGSLETPTTEQPELLVTDNKTLYFNDNNEGLHYEDYTNKVENFYVMPGQSDPGQSDPGQSGPMLCGNSSDSRRCPRGFACIKTGRNPERGFASFDTFSWSLLAVVRIAMQDLWDVLLQLTLQAAGKAYMSAFVLVFFPGCFLAVSLFVAAVAMALVKQEMAEAKKTEEEFSCIVKVLKKSEDSEVFTAIFTAELLLKVLALGVEGYFKVSWHIFDFILVILTVLDLCLADLEGLTVLRSVTLLRPLRLGRWWPALGTLMKIAWFSVGNLSVVLVSVVFMFAVVGTQLFQQNYQDHKENVCMFSSRCNLALWHMTDFSHSFLLVFRVLRGEWSECMWDCMKISNKGLCVIYYTAVVLIGNILVVNLFLYLFLSPSCANKPAAAAGQAPHERHAGSWILDSFGALTGKRTDANTDQKVESKNKDRQDYLALTPVSLGQPSLKHHSNDSVKDSSAVELSRRSPGNNFEIQVDTNNGEKTQNAVLRVTAATAPSMCSSLLVILLVWLIFSILGVNLFAGKFAHCSNHTDGVIFDATNRTQCYELDDGSSTDVHWKPAEFNFDHVGMGLLSLLIMATSADWKEIIYAAVDSTKVHMQPVYESRPVMYLYFVLFIIFGCFFSANLFIRFFVDALHQLSDKAGGKHVFMAEEQLKFHGTVRKMFPKSPEKAAPRPTNRFQARLFDLVTAPLFEILVVALICVNVVVLMMESDDLSEQGVDVLVWFLFVFIILYCIEFFLKITALRRHYFSFGLNILDFVVLVFLILGLFISDLLDKYFVNPATFFVLRLARISRVLPFFRLGRRIQMLLTGFMMSLPALMNIGLLFLLVVYTYSFVGTRIFYTMNFGTIGDSIISMILFSPSSTWSLLVRNSTKYSPPTVVPLWYWADLSAGVVFLCSYVLLHLLLVVHLFIAVVLGSLNSRAAGDASLLQMFYNTWRKFDPEASQVIPYSELSDFCDALQDPLRIPKPNNIRLINMDLPLLPGDQIWCLDVLKALMTQTFGEEREMDSLKVQLEKKFTGNNRTQVSHEPISSTLLRKQEEVAAAVIQRAFRKHQAQNGPPDQPEDETTGASVSSQ